MAKKKEEVKTGGFPGDNGYIGHPPPKLDDVVPVKEAKSEEQVELAICNLVAQGMSVAEAKEALQK